jgi:predicted solute-binding protein
MKKMLIAFTPDSDDLFNYYTWEHGKLAFSATGYQPIFHRKHIIELNHAAQKGQ